MTLARMRTHALALSLCLAVAVGLAAPVVAHAVLIGDGTSNDPLQVSVPFTHEADLVSAADGDFETWYVLQLTKGQTIELTSTAGPALNAFSGIFAANYDDPYVTTSDNIAPGVDRMRFMAPHTDDYYVVVFGSAIGTVSVNAETIPAVRFSLKSTSARSAVKAKKTFSVSAKITPGYNSSTSPMRFYLQRKSGGKWKTFGASKSGELTKDSTAAFSKFSASYKLSKGTYRVRAGFKDAAHPKMKYNSYKTIKVK